MSFWIEKGIKGKRVFKMQKRKSFKLKFMWKSVDSNIENKVSFFFWIFFLFSGSSYIRKTLRDDGFISKAREIRFKYNINVIQWKIKTEDNRMSPPLFNNFDLDSQDATNPSPMTYLCFYSAKKIIDLHGSQWGSFRL